MGFPHTPFLTVAAIYHFIDSLEGRRSGLFCNGSVNNGRRRLKKIYRCDKLLLINMG